MTEHCIPPIGSSFLEGTAAQLTSFLIPRTIRRLVMCGNPGLGLGAEKMTGSGVADERGGVLLLLLLSKKVGLLVLRGDSREMGLVARSQNLKRLLIEVVAMMRR